MSNTITLEQAYDLISQCLALKVDGDYICFPSLDELNGKPDNEWLYVSSFNDNDGYGTTFIEADQEITLEGSTITMLDYQGDVTTLVLLKEWSNAGESL
jgi:hypothetical protein